MTRTATVQRVTNETDVHVTLTLEGSGVHEVHSGIGFLDHMLTHVAVHGLFDLKVQAAGDLDIDEHHTAEDIAICLGQAFNQALGERKGIVRAAHAVMPMDEALALIAVDLSGRPYCVFDASWRTPRLGTLGTDLIGHWFESLAIHARMNLHARVLYGSNDHHQAEALFKALGRALDAASQIDPRRMGAIPSTKGTLKG